MKCKFFLTALLLFAGMSTSLIKAQSMTINLLDGTKQDIALMSLQKISFSNNNLVLNYTNGNTAPFTISTIKKIVVNTSTGIEKNKTEKTKITVFFNASDNQIEITNIPEGSSKVAIYRTDGVLVLNSEISSSNNNVNASGLSKGIYLLKINNQVFKFKK